MKLENLGKLRLRRLVEERTAEHPRKAHVDDPAEVPQIPNAGRSTLTRVPPRHRRSYALRAFNSPPAIKQMQRKVASGTYMSSLRFLFCWALRYIRNIA